MGEVADQYFGGLSILNLAVLLQQHFQLLSNKLQPFDFLLILIIFGLGGHVIQIVLLHRLDIFEYFLQHHLRRNQMDFKDGGFRGIEHGAD